ncbi:MAPEG family protein [Xylariomycetidae sp. FL2044]|nr:MAPEG family protein [Xylariomycetidae sp. FL2044]
MSYAIPIPIEYGYVLTVAASTFFINSYHSVLTVKKRKASGISYPATYASDEQAAKDPKAFAFNCAQRAHANFIENHTSFLGALLISGIRYPVASAVLGAVWAVGRVWYAAGYVSQGPPGRRRGYYLSAVGDIALKVMAVMTGVNTWLST